MLDIESSIEARKIIRQNKYTKQTAGTAARYVQGNVCVLPSKYALDFAAFCQKNPKPCKTSFVFTKYVPLFMNPLVCWCLECISVIMPLLLMQRVA